MSVAHISNFGGLLYQFWWSVSAVSAVRICKYGSSYQYRVKRVSKGGGGTFFIIKEKEVEKNAYFCRKE